MRGQGSLHPVLVLGAGDVGSAVAHALFQAGAAVAMQDGPASPAVPRRGMAFADAFFDGEAALAGVTARRLATPVDLAAALGNAAFLPFFVGTVTEALAAAPWAAVVDARMRKRAAPEDLRPWAPLAVGLGPGFVAGEGADANCHAAVETSWEALGKVVRSGPTLPLRGEPRPIAGVGRERAVYAPAAGLFRTGHAIGGRISAAEPIGTLDGRALLAPLAGALRGLVRDAVPVEEGAKVAEVDPRGDPALCFGLGERPRRIAEGVSALLLGSGPRPDPGPRRRGCFPQREPKVTPTLPQRHGWSPAMDKAPHAEGRPADPEGTPLRVALVWRGDPEAPDEPTKHRSRLQPLADALAEAGREVEWVAYSDDAVEAARDRLLRCDGAMVWVNPLDDGRDRSRLDPMLRDVARAGVWVSAHPDVILKMGTKEVLFRTRDLGWGADTDLYETFQAFQERFPSRLWAGAPRVLKPKRGNGGQGVWKVQLDRGGEPGRSGAPASSPDAAMVVVQAAADDRVEVVPVPEFIERCRPYFSGAGCIVDQAFQPRVGEGMVRCYLSQDEVVGFSEQWPRVAATKAGAPALGMASAKTMHGPSAAPFQRLRWLMEDTWLPSMLGVLDLAPAALPAIWDADFLLGPPDAAREDTYVLCEINVSSVLPFPDAAAGSVARTAAKRLEAARRARRGPRPAA